MATNNKKWIQKATAKMKKKGTEGSFRKYCGGKVTMECIERGLKSNDPAIRKKAQFAKNVAFRKLLGGTIYAEGGDVKEPLSVLLLRFSPSTINDILDDAIRGEDKKEELRRAAALYGMDVREKKYQEGGEAEVPMEEAEGQPEATQEAAPQAGQEGGRPNISYEEYVKFVLAYPEYFKQLITDIQQMQQQQQAQAQAQPAPQGEPAPMTEGQ